MVQAVIRGSDPQAGQDIVLTAHLQEGQQSVNDDATGCANLLEIGRALMTDPQCILLDEPIAGVNPTLAGEIARHLEALRADGLTFLIIEHHLDVIARLCDPVVVMAEGRHLAEGSFAALAADPRVQEAYMGRRGVA